MIYLQLRSRISKPVGTPVLLRDIATFAGDDVPPDLIIHCPDQKGIWRIDAIQCIQLLKQALPDEEIVLLGPQSCCIHRDPPPHRDLTKPLRTVAALTILLIGSALGLAWFHSDVSMPQAMQDVYTLVTGEPQPSDPRLITIPYVLGVALGTAVFYALGSPHTTTPLDVKLSDYRDDMERADARDVE